MTTLQEYLEKECDAYILKVKKDPIKVLTNYLWQISFPISISPLFHIYPTPLACQEKQH